MRTVFIRCLYQQTYVDCKVKCMCDESNQRISFESNSVAKGESEWDVAVRRAKHSDSREVKILNDFTAVFFSPLFGCNQIENFYTNNMICRV